MGTLPAPMNCILALDQGTTSSRAILFDQLGAVRATAQKEYTQYFPQPGWVEHDAQEIWATQYGVAMEAMAMAGVGPKEVAAIGITNQRETTIVWDRKTGEPVCRAIVWQDRRTAGFCDQLKRDGLEKLIRAKTGLVIDAYFSASKLRWMLDHIPNGHAAAENGELAFGTVDAWLLWKLSGGTLHITDPSNASRTMLFNIHIGAWDDDLIDIFKVPKAMLPRVVRSSEVYGEAAGLGIPLAGIAGDQQAALFGQACHSPGMVKNTYGTGCFMLMNTGAQPVESSHNLVSTVAWDTGAGMAYALEGSIFIAGAVVQWLRDGLGIIKRAADIEALAASVPDNGGVYLVPAFAGLGAPYWDQYARGSISGLTRGSTAGHIARAALEGIAFQVGDVLSAMEADSGICITELRVDGGATANNMLMQFQADVLGVPVVRPAIAETTALGAACLAGLAVGFWRTMDEIAAQWKAERRFEPAMAPAKRDKLRAGWKKAVSRAEAWEDATGD
jgi:glycerol kinase